MGLSNQENNQDFSMYAGLPVNIFAGSDLAECLDEDLLKKRVKHYQYMDKQFMDDLRNDMNKYIYDEEKKMNFDILNILLFFIRNHKNEELITDKERIVLIKKYMEDKINFNWRMREKACELIQYVQDNDEIVSLIKLGLNDKESWQVREKACEMIQYVNDKFERIILIKLLINDPDSHVRAKACEMIQYVQDSDEIVALIKEGMKDGESFNVKAKACEMIQYVQDSDEMVVLIKEGMKDQNYDVREKACEMIQYVKNKDKMVVLIKEGMKDRESFKVRRKVCEMIQYVEDENEKVCLIKLGMQDNFYASFIVRDKAREMIHYVKDDNERVVLIKLCMENADPDVSAKAYEMMIQYLEDNEEKIVVIKKIMEDSDPDVREKAYEIIIKYVEDKEQRVLLIKKLMEDSDPDVREKVCDKMQQKKIIIDSDILLEKESHGLYTYQGGGSSKQSNTGGIMITDSYVGKAYQRILSVSPFLCRKNAWEGIETWKQLGFSYVPIEPILSFRYKEQKITVVSKLLQMSLDELSDQYSTVYQYYEEYIEKEKANIVTGLKMLGIDHDDIADRNFCVQFSYTQEGKIDISIAPRIYLIDWDKAKFIS